MKYARKCSVTGEGMNAGWVFGDGVFYTKYYKDALAECRKDRDAILHDIKDVDAMMIQDPSEWVAFAEAVDRATLDKDSDQDLLTIAFHTEYCYYTEWEDEEEYEEI
jgi:hypothetical protein